MHPSPRAAGPTSEWPDPIGSVTDLRAEPPPTDRLMATSAAELPGAGSGADPPFIMSEARVLEPRAKRADKALVRRDARGRVGGAKRPDGPPEAAAPPPPPPSVIAPIIEPPRAWPAESLPASASLMPSAVALRALPQKSVVPSAPMMTRCGTELKPKAVLALSFVSRSMPPCVMCSQSCSSTSSWAKSGSSRHRAAKTTLSPRASAILSSLSRHAGPVWESFP